MTLLLPPLTFATSGELSTTTSTEALENMVGSSVKLAINVKVYVSPLFRVLRGTNSLGVFFDLESSLMSEDDTSHW